MNLSTIEIMSGCLLSFIVFCSCLFYICRP